jgi:hypothetical protein
VYNGDSFEGKEKVLKWKEAKTADARMSSGGV